MNATITSADWKRSFAAMRRAPNVFAQQIRAGLALAGIMAAPTMPAAVNTQSESLDVGRMVAVLRSLENGPSENPWQFEHSTWIAYSKVPIATASPQEHRRVAWQFASTCVRQCLSLDWEITADRVALLWNAGYGTIVKNELTPAHHDFAHRALALYADKSFAH